MYEGVLDRLRDVRREGRFWKALCPAHEDSTPSLRLWVGDNGGLIGRCYACSATFAELCRATGTKPKDWYPPREKGFKPVPRKILSVYPFHDEAGKLLCQEVRLEPVPPEKKCVRYRRPMPDGRWAWSLDGGFFRRCGNQWKLREGDELRPGDVALEPVRRVPYMLPEVLAAAERVVFVVEGPKDAETLRRLGFVATSAPCGSRSWSPDMGRYLAGRKVVVVPDADEAGPHYACAVMGSCLVHGAAEVRLWPLPPMTAGKDVTDLLGGDWKSLPDPRREIVRRVSLCMPWRNGR